MMCAARVSVCAILCATLAATLVACGASYPAYPQVPAPLEEQVSAPPPSPVPLIWQPGHYDWNGAGYAWQRGQWVPRDGHGTLWQDGYWVREGERYRWVPAHWT
ncbi:MAG: YXWGXW repeat-containing protein [Acetobacteraceae bacterium]|nr:YXWGXW repeat-containing protein [Acetobacteraceae bacterium]